MKIQSLGFIGGGRITRIFLQAFKNKKTSISEVVFFDTNENTALKLKQKFPDIHMANTAAEAAQCDVVFVALHPPVIIETLAGIKDFVSKDAVLVSLAPKIPIQKIRSAVNVPNIMRLIPNATSIINEGYNPFCFANGFNSSRKIEILSIIDILGKAFETDETKLEAYAIVSAMLPTYFWFQWKTLVELGIDTGLESSESNQSVMQTLEAAIKLMFKSGMSYDEVTDLIPVKPIGDNEDDINQILQSQLMGLYEKIKT